MARIQVHRMSEAEKAKELERLRDRARHNEAAALANAERKAEYQRSIKIAQSLRNDGMSVDAISKHTGLMVDDILRL